EDRRVDLVGAGGPLQRVRQANATQGLAVTAPDLIDSPEAWAVLETVLAEAEVELLASDLVPASSPDLLQRSRGRSGRRLVAEDPSARVEGPLLSGTLRVPGPAVDAEVRFATASRGEDHLNPSRLALRQDQGPVEDDLREHSTARPDGLARRREGHLHVGGARQQDGSPDAMVVEVRRRRPLQLDLPHGERRLQGPAEQGMLGGAVGTQPGADAR